MKKLYLLAATFLATFAAAQNVNPATPRATNDNSIVILDQPSEDYESISSTELPDGRGVYAADDFVITENAKLTKLRFEGLQWSFGISFTPEILLGAQLYIYEDADGEPSGIPGDGTPSVYHKKFNKGDAGFAWEFDADLHLIFNIDLKQVAGGDVNLEANKHYWIVFAPIINGTKGFFMDSFIFMNSLNHKFSNAKVVEKGNALGLGLDYWTDITEILGNDTRKSLSMKIMGETATMGVSELYNSLSELSVYPNPTADRLNVRTADAKTNIHSQIFDSNGRLVMTAQGTAIDVSKLAKGVYSISVMDQNEVQLSSTRFIKK